MPQPEDLPVGAPVPGWSPRPLPAHAPITGRTVQLEPLTLAHAAALHAANGADRDERMWTYLPYGPFADAGAYTAWVEEKAQSRDPLFFTVIPAATGTPAGVLSLMRIDPANGVIEIGHLAFSPALQRTVAATEAVFLLMAHAFDDLGYRRFEWKCDALNAPSRRAALRFGFSFEGVFRQAVVVKGRNRDTAWFAIIDKDWPHLREDFRRWLAPENFDATGRQRRSLLQEPLSR